MVVWSAPARADLNAIHDFIARNSPFYAKKVVRDIHGRVSLLEQLPRIGRKMPELNDDQVREIPLYSYRIVYRIREENVFILGVIHKRRDLQAADIQ